MRGYCRFVGYRYFYYFPFTYFHLFSFLHQDKGIRGGLGFKWERNELGRFYGGFPLYGNVRVVVEQDQVTSDIV
jgi:hypothetical protein